MTNHYARKLTEKDQETTINVFNEVNELRKFKDKLVNNYENYKLLFVCLAHYGKDKSKLEDKTIDENEADEHYDLNEEQNEQCLINVSPDATINVGDDSRKQIFDELGSLNFAPNAIISHEISTHNALYPDDDTMSFNEPTSDNESILNLT